MEPKIADLEIKDAKLIFQAVWQELEGTYAREELRFPREIIWLGGAPGAGKGTNTAFIRESRAISAPSIVISQLLNSPEAEKLKNAGNMVGDRDAILALLRELLKREYESGVIVDGFPRTMVQVEFLKLFYNKIIELRAEFRAGKTGNYFSPSLFHIALLFVDERISVERQLKRGREVRAHNQRVLESGVGALLEERVTDYSEEKARNRYRVFKETTYEALLSLQKIFHFHFIDASGTLGDVQENIFQEFQYQSSLELNQSTFALLQPIPLASAIVQNARRNLVQRLEAYQAEHPKLFDDVIKLIVRKFIPIIERHASSGTALINSEDPLLDQGLSLAMVIDILSERGYQVVIDVHKVDVPVAFDLEQMTIHCNLKRVYSVHVRFSGSEIRRGLF